MEQPIETSQTSPVDNEANSHRSVSVHQDDTVGAIFLGLLALVLAVAYIRSEARQRSLLAQIQPA
jgi:hypothetical protein